MSGPSAACFKLLPSATITNDVQGQTNLGFLFFLFPSFFFLFFSPRHDLSALRRLKFENHLSSIWGASRTQLTPFIVTPFIYGKGYTSRSLYVRTCGPILPMETDPGIVIEFPFLPSIPRMSQPHSFLQPFFKLLQF